MRWPFSRQADGAEPPPWPPRMAHPADDGAAVGAPFVCTTCGRTDLPEAGDWDPPVCLECDAAINFDTEEAER
jgi:hypothetical protein